MEALLSPLLLSLVSLIPETLWRWFVPLLMRTVIPLITPTIIPSPFPLALLPRRPDGNMGQQMRSVEVRKLGSMTTWTLMP
jgi:hypothetical protein